MKAHYEKVVYEPGESWRFFHRQLEALPFEWHYHPEYELTLTVNSAGQRFVGDHMAPYHSGDLVLVGPNLPHSWQSRHRPDPTRSHTAYVLWFSQAWVDHLIAGFPEYEPIRSLLGDSASGLAFDAATSRSLRPEFEALVGAEPRERLRRLLAILDGLMSSEGERLASAAFNAEGPARAEQTQLARILDRVHADYAQSMPVTDLAEQVHMSPATLNRFFRRHMKQSLHHYRTQVRLGHACAALMADDTPVSVIADRHGFRNMANFNRLFRKYRGCTPTEFRRAYQ